MRRENSGKIHERPLAFLVGGEWENGKKRRMQMDRLGEFFQCVFVWICVRLCARVYKVSHGQQPIHLNWWRVHENVFEKV